VNKSINHRNYLKVAKKEFEIFFISKQKRRSYEVMNITNNNSREIDG
jgi:hypothetical protein